jgi:hypothetical protein
MLTRIGYNLKCNPVPRLKSASVSKAAKVTQTQKKKKKPIAATIPQGLLDDDDSSSSEEEQENRSVNRNDALVPLPTATVSPTPIPSVPSIVSAPRAATTSVSITRKRSQPESGFDVVPAEKESRLPPPPPPMAVPAAVPVPIPSADLQQRLQQMQQMQQWSLQRTMRVMQSYQAQQQQSALRTPAVRAADGTFVNPWSLVPTPPTPFNQSQQQAPQQAAAIVSEQPCEEPAMNITIPSESDDDDEEAAPRSVSEGKGNGHGIAVSVPPSTTSAPAPPLSTSSSSSSSSSSFVSCKSPESQRRMSSSDSTASVSAKSPTSMWWSVYDNHDATAADEHDFQETVIHRFADDKHGKSGRIPMDGPVTAIVDDEIKIRFEATTAQEVNDDDNNNNKKQQQRVRHVWARDFMFTANLVSRVIRGEKNIELELFLFESSLRLTVILAGDVKHHYWYCKKDQITNNNHHLVVDLTDVAECEMLSVAVSPFYRAVS